MVEIVTGARTAPRRNGGLLDYLALARFDHATKHVFILPGIILAYALRDPDLENAGFSIVAGLLSAVLIASANYVINEWLDRDFDAFHPSKSKRTAVNTSLSPPVVYLQYLFFAGIGLALAGKVGTLFLLVSIAFLLSGIVYNVRPLRSKDKAYLDVLTESINNPIRLMLGWTMLDHETLPPSSLLLAYWMGGAFLMGAKRLSEYREIAAGTGLQTLHRYRRSFQHYTETSLTVSCFLYGLLSAFFIAVFLVKYRIEYVLALPAFATLFALYFAISLETESVAQKPEHLFREWRLMMVSGITAVLLLVLTFVNIPVLTHLSTPHYVGLSMK